MRYDINVDRKPWILPEDYESLSPLTQQEILRGCIVSYMEEFGKARISEIANIIGVSDKKYTTLKKNLNYLVTTQQLYSDGRWKDPTYYSNGRLGHPLLQSNLKVGRKEYVIRSYSGEIGKWVTVTEYERTPTNDLIPRSGLRVDMQYAKYLADELTRIQSAFEENPQLMGANKLKRRVKE